MMTVGITAKVAVTALAASMVTTHDPVPAHAPDQPLNVAFVLAVAVKVTQLFLPKLPLQVVPQVMPAGELETVPVPVPAIVTVSGI